MEPTYTVILTLAFADASTRSFRFNGVDAAEYQNVKTKVKAINANMPATFKTTFVSAKGAECVMISRAQWIESSEEVIYHAS